MNLMADTVIKDQDAKALEEENKIRKYELQRDMRLKQDEQRKLKRFQDSNQQCKSFLFQQIEEKKRQEILEKEHNDE